QNGKDIDEVKLTGQGLGEMLGLLEKGTINNKIAKTVFKEMLETGKAPQVIVEEKGLVQISDTGAIKEIVEKVVAANPQSVEDFRAGKDKAIGFLVGQVMKESKGKANPGLVNELLREVLKG
ncbi:MAG: Asp-tRNA(Asn)/Glu-tRNA(Gln) amidotransferase GatCAB subunit B, partial [Paenibacillus sp.]|nr:Asp-tRNA(Asn)/Glu-tRNA(Gln) amidotransferase GatCAB subunit B [Paenibacillus sp.]